MRVRLVRIDSADLNTFEFDYDLTFMVFFLNAEGQVYARYGGRDSENADNRQSLAGLRYTMESVLRMHASEQKVFAPKQQEKPRYLRDIGRPLGGGCVHCHQVKEVMHDRLQKEGRWETSAVYRFPPPDNLGFVLEVDRGNVVREVKEGSAAARAGLKKDDVITRLGGVPIHSFGDAQLALDRAARTGSIEAAWQRGGQALQARLELVEGWRKTDVSWRASIRYLIPFARLYGTDLTADEKKALGLSPRQLAFRQKETMPQQAADAGVKPGDIILGMDGRVLETNVDGFLHHVRSTYLIGDQATINVIRDGKRLNLTMKFVP